MTDDRPDIPDTVSFGAREVPHDEAPDERAERRPSSPSPADAVQDASAVYLSGPLPVCDYTGDSDEPC